MTTLNKTRGFEVISEEFRKNKGAEIKLPQRKTKSSIGYDFHSPIDFTLEPNEKIMLWTDVKAYFGENEALLLNVRSSMGKYPIFLCNMQGWIESDYYSNPSNDGNLGFMFWNMGDKPWEVKAGDAIGQGMFINYLVSDNGNTENIRTGGWGSTDKDKK